MTLNTQTPSTATALMLSEKDIQALFRYAMTLCQHKENAEDILHASLEKYFIKLEEGNSIRNAMAFVRASIRNRFVDGYRQQQTRSEESFEEQADYDISPVDIESVTINERALKEVWATLNANEREALYYWAVLGMSTDEVCRELNITRGTFLSRIHRLRKRCNNQFNTSPESRQNAMGETAL